MQKFAYVLVLLPLAACSTSGLTAEQKKLGMKSVSSLSSQYDRDTYFASVRRRSDGRNNAWGRDLSAISDFIDRHLWNYDARDPYVNYPSDTTKLEHVGRFGLNTVTAVPGVDEITTRL
ncbi:MAG: hypothetical protein JNK49_11675 [Planctomycetes bacterium]|nr:hypothetical protein [Planctomycetota bacterium]